MFGELPRHRRPFPEEYEQYYCGSAKPEPEMYFNQAGKLKEVGHWLTPSGAIKTRNLMGEIIWHPYPTPVGSIEQLKAARRYWVAVIARLTRDHAAMTKVVEQPHLGAVWTWRTDVYGPEIVDGRYTSREESGKIVLAHLAKLMSDATQALVDLDDRIAAKVKAEYLGRGLTLLPPEHSQYRPELDPTLAR